MRVQDVSSEAALVKSGGEPVRATTINVDDLVRLDGPDGAVEWAKVTWLEAKPKTIWLWLQPTSPNLVGELHIRPHHDDMFAVRRAREET